MFLYLTINMQDLSIRYLHKSKAPVAGIFITSSQSRHREAGIRGQGSGIRDQGAGVRGKWKVESDYRQ